MAKCARCGAETALYLLASPICIDCESGAVRKPPPKNRSMIQMMIPKDENLNANNRRHEGQPLSKPSDFGAFEK
jgi:hypothetical protein